MQPTRKHITPGTTGRIRRLLCCVCVCMLAACLTLPAFASRDTLSVPDETRIPAQIVDTLLVHQSIEMSDDSLSILGTDTIPIAQVFEPFKTYDSWEERDEVFSPSPTRAVWMSALFPGLGQIYNRRYWKLPIVVGAYLGLGYATNWNNTMLSDYQRAYMDIMDSDPSTNSYMDFFPPNTLESNLDKEWLKRLLKSRKDFYRRNRDLCIICMVGVYFLAMVDAYVDASLSHFDISPDLSIDWSPTVIPDMRGKAPGVGLTWALNF